MTGTLLYLSLKQNMVDERQLEEPTLQEAQSFPKPSESSKITTEAIDRFVEKARTRLDPLLGSAAAICTGAALNSLLMSGDFQTFFQYWLMSSVLMLLSDLGKDTRKKKGINEGSPKKVQE